MENPSLRVTGPVSSMNRTFIAEDYAEDDFGQWAKDEVTGEQFYVGDERSCFRTWDDIECVWQSRPYQGPPTENKTHEWKCEAQRFFQKEAEEHSLAKNKHKILKCGQRRTLLGAPKDAKARKACQKTMMAFRRVVFALTSQIKAQARIVPRTKARESSKKEKVRKKLILNPDIQPLKHLKKKDIVMTENLMTGLPVSGLMILGLQLLDGIARKLTLLGWRYPL